MLMKYTGHKFVVIVAQNPQKFMSEHVVLKFIFSRGEVGHAYGLPLDMLPMKMLCIIIYPPPPPTPHKTIMHSSLHTPFLCI